MPHILSQTAEHMNPQPSSTAAPAQFAQLMELYEHNYILMRRLFGDLKRLKTGDECPWHAEVGAQVRSATRHTLDIHFIDQRQLDKKQRPMRIKVRICHDARTAELVENSRRAHCLKTKATHCIKKQFSQNKLLNAWLSGEVARFQPA